MPHTIVKNEESFLFVESTGQVDLVPGVYECSMEYYDGEDKPGFKLLNPDNDTPVSCEPLASNLAKEIAKFLQKESAYKALGLAHKRGFLLYGQPGCGKSATLRLIEEEFIKAFNGVVLLWQPGSGALSAFYDEYRKYNKTTPVMVVAEDIEASISRFEEHILEFLDGQKGLNNFVLVATTNNFDAIPARIKDRPSRIDRCIEIKLPSGATIRKYLESRRLTEQQVSNLFPYTQGMSVAQVKELVIATVLLEENPKDVRARMLSSLKKGAFVESHIDQDSADFQELLEAVKVESDQ